MINETLEFNVICRKSTNNKLKAYYTYGHYRTKEEAYEVVKHVLKDQLFHNTINFSIEDGESNDVWLASKELVDGRIVSLEIAIISNRLTLEA